MKNIKYILMLTALLLSLSAGASRPAAVVRYDFKHVRGQVVPDKGPFHLDGTMQGSAQAVPEGASYAVDLGNDGGYIDMGAALGDRLKQLEKWSVAVKYRVDPSASLQGNGYFLWAFSVLELNTADKGRYHAYKLNYQRSETTASGWSHETTLEIGRASEKGVWQYAVYTQDGTKGRLYLNGQEVASNDQMLTMEEAFAGESPVCNWIGRAPFRGDAYLGGTKIGAVAIYADALTVPQIKKLLKK
ncbi:MAG: hypothetical protein IKI72_07210 [Bacteroidales bacterium]|nr:hypothetical protein [Bacteroidales bacterium]